MKYGERMKKIEVSTFILSVKKQNMKEEEEEE